MTAELCCGFVGLWVEILRGEVRLYLDESVRIWVEIGVF